MAAGPTGHPDALPAPGAVDRPPRPAHGRAGLTGRSRPRNPGFESAASEMRINTSPRGAAVPSEQPARTRPVLPSEPAARRPRPARNVRRPAARPGPGRDRGTGGGGPPPGCWVLAPVRDPGRTRPGRDQGRVQGPAVDLNRVVALKVVVGGGRVVRIGPRPKSSAPERGRGVRVSGSTPAARIMAIELSPSACPTGRSRSPRGRPRRWWERIARGVAAAPRRGSSTGDWKLPTSSLPTRPGEPKVADFGLAGRWTNTREVMGARRLGHAEGRTKFAGPRPNMWASG